MTRIGDNGPRGSAPIFSLAPRGICRNAAAAYIGVSPCKFDEMVADHRMPAPRRIDGRKVWDVRDLDLAFDALPYESGAAVKTTWDDFRQS
jgi:hypothetical protein